MTRTEKVQRAQKLREQGLKQREIAERMGVARRTVNAWFVDPDGSKLKARKDSYRGTCEECGSQTTGCNGPAKAPRLCAPCSKSAQAVWSRERIIEAIRRWEEIYCRPPGLIDWSPGHLRKASLTDAMKSRKIERFQTGDWPSFKTVEYHFGSWGAGIAAAGFAQNSAGDRWEGA